MEEEKNDPLMENILVQSHRVNNSEELTNRSSGQMDFELKNPVLK